MKTIQLSLMTGAMLLMSCTSAPQKDVKSAPQDSAQITATDTLQAFYGTYEGTLPAADCEGIRTTLTLNDDTTYRLVCEYLGKEEAPVETNGVYEKKGEHLVMLITPSSGEKTFYKITKDSVVLTDSLGSDNEGALADFYVLKKK